MQSKLLQKVEPIKDTEFEDEQYIPITPENMWMIHNEISGKES